MVSGQSRHEVHKVIVLFYLTQFSLIAAHHAQDHINHTVQLVFIRQLSPSPPKLPADSFPRTVQDIVHSQNTRRTSLSALSYMQRQPSESSEQICQSNNTPAPSSSSQHGFLHHGPSDIRQVRSASSSCGSHSASPHSVSELDREPRDAVDADRLDEKLRGLSLHGKLKTSLNRPITAGQRVSDYENALTPPTPRQALGFKVIRRSDSSDGPQMTDFPNG